jgi:poly(3-hydroxybutyrate) depolymerase
MDAAGQMYLSGFLDVEDAHVVWVDGFRNSWAAGPGVYDPAWSAGVDHVSCLSEIIADQKKTYAISHVAVSGMSSGCAMSQTLALSTDLVDVVACASHGAAILNFTSSKKVDFMLVMGELDHIYLRGVEHTLGLWSEKNACSGYSTSGSTRTYSCDNGRLVYRLLGNANHVFPGTAQQTMPFIRDAGFRGASNLSMPRSHLH